MTPSNLQIIEEKKNEASLFLLPSDLDCDTRDHNSFGQSNEKRAFSLFIAIYRYRQTNVFNYRRKNYY